LSQDSPRASRLATPRWLDGRLVVGVLMVLFSVVAGARVFAAADRYTQVYVARHDLVPGEHLSATDLAVGQVRLPGVGPAYIAAGVPPVGYVVTRYVAPGELIPRAALSASPAAVTASRFVTLPVQSGHLPVDLGHGDLVDVYLTTKSTSGAPPSPVLVLSAVPVDSADDGSGSLSGTTAMSVVLSVPADKVNRAIAAVEGGTIDLVRVPAAAVAAIEP
jgi:hypothetical protein